MALAAIAFVAICVVEVGQTLRLERKWNTVTGQYRTMVSFVENKLDQTDGLDVCVVDNPPIRYGYLKGALLLERPKWKLVEGNGQQQFALAHKPCLYLKFVQQGDRLRISSTPLR